MKPLIAIAGGIGCGKSIISAILAAMGYKVYDCDSRAKSLMDKSDSIKDAIAAEITPKAITPERNIDRKVLADIVFNDREKLNRLNNLVHSAVKEDLLRWKNDNPDTPLWVESAIIHESGIHLMVDEMWNVTAPEDIRIERVMKRNGLTEQEVRRRIESQTIDAESPSLRIFTVLNDGVQPVLPQILNLIGRLPN